MLTTRRAPLSRRKKIPIRWLNQTGPSPTLRDRAMNLTPDIFYEDPDTGIGFASIDAAAGYEVLVNALKRRPKAPEGLDPDLFQKLVVSAPEKVDMATDPLSVMRWA